MQKSVANDKTFFHQNHRPRVNNPTFVSSFMADSLTVLSPPSAFHRKVHNDSEYRSGFDRSNIPSNIFINVKASNYAKTTMANQFKSKSHLSNYGATIMRQSQISSHSP